MTGRRTDRDILHLLSPPARAALRREVAAGATAAGSPRAIYEAMRRHWNEPAVPGVGISDHAPEIDGRALPMRVFRPANPDTGDVAAVVYLHGGGFSLGSPRTHARIMACLARLSGRPVVGIDYPLAPETRFPAAIEILTALLGAFPVLAPSLGMSPRPPALAGDSAGAHLALAATLFTGAADHRPTALLLYYGFYTRHRPPSRRRLASALSGLTEREIERMERAYLGRREHRRDRRFDLLSADLSGLPPTFLAAAGADPLVDDSRLLAAHAPAARLRVYPNVPHGFLHWSRAVPEARRALADGAAFLARPYAGIPCPKVEWRERHTVRTVGPEHDL